MKFVIASIHRSGSKILRSCLNSVEGIHCREEILRSVDEPRDRELIEDFFLSEGKHGHLGFDLKYTHSSPGVEKYMEENDVKVIQLVRRDMLETVLWNQKNLEGRLDGGFGPPLILLDEKYEARIGLILSEVDRLKSEIDRWKEKSDVFVWYEDDLTGGGGNTTEFVNPGKRNELLDFFGKEDQRLFIEKKPGHTKNKRPPNHEIITNWKDLLHEMDNSRVQRYYE